MIGRRRQYVFDIGWRTNLLMLFLILIYICFGPPPILCPTRVFYQATSLRILLSRLTQSNILTQFFQGFIPFWLNLYIELVSSWPLLMWLADQAHLTFNLILLLFAFQLLTVLSLIPRPKKTIEIRIKVNNQFIYFFNFSF